MLIDVLDDLVFLFPTFSVVSVVNCALWFPFLSARLRSATKMDEHEYTIFNYQHKIQSLCGLNFMNIY